MTKGTIALDRVAATKKKNNYFDTVYRITKDIVGDCNASDPGWCPADEVVAAHLKTSGKISPLAGDDTDPLNINGVKPSAFTASLRYFSVRPLHSLPRC